MTTQQFQKYVYNDSELTSDEMLAAAGVHLDDPECWGAPGIDGYDEDEAEATP